MIGRSLTAAIASMTRWLNSFGTVLTPMIPVGFSALTASAKSLTGAWSRANGFWKSARSVRDVTISPLMSNSGLRPRAAGDVESLEGHGLRDELRDAGSGRTAAQKQEAFAR